MKLTLCCQQAASAKADAVIADNPDQSLDALVAAKKINTDQKAQVLKKPGLQAQLAQYEEQVTQVRKVENDLEDRFAVERKHLVELHQEQLVKAKEDAGAEAASTLSRKLDDDLLVLSQFLHAAAAKRQTAEAESEEGRAFEGALLLVYQGNNASLSTLKNLITGSTDKVTSTLGEPLDYTFAQIKQSSIDDAPPLEEPLDEDQPEDSEPTILATDEDEAPTSSVTDPTVAHAGLTELEDTVSIPVNVKVNGTTDSEPMPVPEQSSTTASAANAVAENAWDPQASVMTNDSGNGDGWVEVPRDPAETDTGVTATPAAMHGGNSWAEEVTEVEEKATVENDGFEPVVHHPNRDRPRGRGRGGEFRGRGRGEGGRGEGGRGGRGRGDRGDGSERRGGRGRGRGEGPRGGNRGARGRDGPAAPKPVES